MLQDDFDKLMGYFQQINEGKVVDLNEVLKAYFQFMEDIQKEIQATKTEDRKDLFRNLTMMYTKILQEAKKINEKTGMTEEQLASFASNPANFSEDTWRMLQDARKKMADAGQRLSSSISERQEFLENKEGGVPRPPQEGGPKPKKPDDKKPKGPPHQKWIKS